MRVEGHSQLPLKDGRGKGPLYLPQTELLKFLDFEISYLVNSEVLNLKLLYTTLKMFVCTRAGPWPPAYAAEVVHLPHV